MERASSDTLNNNLCKEPAMRATIDLEDKLLADARRLTALVHAGLRVLIERESARRLALLGGTEPHLGPVPRQRPESA
jgi:Arc/MetJ family transcription regulator